MHGDGFDWALFGTEAASFAIIKVTVVESQAFGIFLTSRKTDTFRTDAVAGSATDADFVVNNWIINPPGAGFVDGRRSRFGKQFNCFFILHLKFIN